ncbi:MAG: DUF2125 domain-containing protein [Methylovirgula sp.]
MAREKVFHRAWSCPNREIAGFPNAIKIACSKPQFDGMIFGRHYAGSLGGFVATADIHDPNNIVINVGSPFSAIDDDKTTDIALAWEHLNVRLGGLPQNVTEISLAGGDVSLQGHAPGLGALAARAKQADATLTHDATRPDHGIHFDITLDGASFPAVDAFLGDTAPAEITAVGDVTQVSFDPAKTLAQSLDQWRAVNGQVVLSKLVITRGETKVEASGPLGLSPSHQIQGALKTKTVGFEPVLQRLGVDPALITAGSLLVSLLGGGGKEDPKAGPQPLTITVGFNSGRLIIGPVRTSIQLAPLY